MSFRTPAFPREARGEVGLLPTTCIKQALLQYFAFFHGKERNSFLQEVLRQTTSIRGTLIVPLYGFGLPRRLLEIFFFVSSVCPPRKTLLHLAAQLFEQYRFGSEGITENLIPHSDLEHSRSSNLYGKFKSLFFQAALALRLCLFLYSGSAYERLLPIALSIP